MEVTVNKELAHMFDDYELNEGDKLKVEHFAYGIFYTIKEPLELSGVTIHRDNFDIM